MKPHHVLSRVYASADLLDRLIVYVRTFCTLGTI